MTTESNTGHFPNPDTVNPMSTMMSATNEEDELAFVKGLRTGKITIQTDESLDVGRPGDEDNDGVDYPGNINKTLQNFMDERDR